MNGYNFTLNGADLTALGSGALYWPAQNLLCVSDLHFGKSERRARRGQPPLPPYETRDTLSRLEADIAKTDARMIVCLGDSFDDSAAAGALLDDEKLWIASLQAGRRWIWIEGNHDPGPVNLGGTHLAELCLLPLTFRHIARMGEKGEISGHYHPKVSLRFKGCHLSRPAFLIDKTRVILPAYGTYTGGVRSTDSCLQALMGPGAMAVLTGPVPRPAPMPR